MPKKVEELETKAYIAFHEWKDAKSTMQATKKQQKYNKLMDDLKKAEDEAQRR